MGLKGMGKDLDPFTVILCKVISFIKKILKYGDFLPTVFPEWEMRPSIKSEGGKFGMHQIRSARQGMSLQEIDANNYKIQKRTDPCMGNKNV